RSDSGHCVGVRAVRAVSPHRAHWPVVGTGSGQEQRPTKTAGRVARVDSVTALAQIEQLRWRYSVGDWGLRGVDLQLDPGERVGIVGRSGSGKSSLALTFNGIIPQSYAGQMAGRVLIAGQPAAATPVAELADSVAMVFQSPDDQMSQILVRHEIASGPANRGLPLAEVQRRTADALAALHIEDLADRETASLSGGE